jgi:hypothetical protein
MRAKTVAITKITDPVIAKKIEDATRGLIPSYARRLSYCNTKHIIVICDYISALRSEIKLSDTYRQYIFVTLMGLSKYVPSKKFKDFTRADVIRYLDHFRKDESEDPAHKWIGTTVWLISSGSSNGYTVLIWNLRRDLNPR